MRGPDPHPDLRQSPARPLSVGLCGEDAAWKSLLDSEGLAWAVLEARDDRPCVEVAVLPRREAGRYRAAADRVLHCGGCVIAEPGAFPPGTPADIARRRFPYHHQTFGGLPSCEHPEAVEVVSSRREAGRAYTLPFELARAWGAYKPERRHVRISDKRGHPVWDTLAPVAGKNVRRVIVETLQQAFFDLELPLVRKWYWPAGRRSVFCLRGDMDGGPAENLNRYLDAVAPFARCLSLSVCGQAYTGKTELLRRARETGAELGNHTFCHYVYRDLDANRANIQLVERLLGTLGVRPRGFVGPACFWHASAYAALEENDYLYASSFGLAHDDLPHYPVLDGRCSKVLEIPFHCMGDRFDRFGMDLDGPEVADFFGRLIDKKHAAGEPINLYGHPDMAGRLGEQPQLVRSICERALGMPNVWSGQLRELAEWWARRHAAAAELSCDSATGTVTCTELKAPAGASDVFWSLHTADGRWFLVDAETLRRGFRLDDVPAQPPLRMPASMDVGEVVHDPGVTTLRRRLAEWKREWLRRRRKRRELAQALRASGGE